MRALTPLLVCSALLQSRTASADDRIAAGDAARFKPFDVKYEAGRQVAAHGDSPAHWNFQQPDESVSGEALVMLDKATGTAALALRKTEGALPLQCSQDNIHLDAGKTYLLEITYLTRGGSGAIKLQVADSDREKGQSIDVSLADTQGQWKTLTAPLSNASAAQYTLLFQCYGVGVDKALSLSHVSLRQK